MLKPAILAAVASIALAGCQEQIDRQADRIGNAVSDDVNDAAANVSSSLDNLGDAIRGQADRVGARAADEAANQTSRAANDLADQIRRHGDRAVDDVGAALQGAGASLRDRDRGRAPAEDRGYGDRGYDRADERDQRDDRR
ncbi:hypothetical protein [uncultured Sphingomonas sp.]|uniref:hypothetical protein n=1 Tax=uncultured Sphingomonas sp. TaxID=158754 RepID=UPI0026285085|nr:hypothetical protein [uncultured Sphingomonas sp.]